MAMEPKKGTEVESTSTAATSSTPPAEVVGDERNLRRALEDAMARDATAKAALAKSDAVILELRGSVKKLKQQLETLQDEKQQGDAIQAKLRHELDRLSEETELYLQQEQETHERSVNELKSQLAVSNTQAREAVVGELQVQLDRAHAQILTSDMVRKELEDTLEAEQYTWELRVQDQERTITTLQQECRTLREDLEHCRSQWKEAEEGWTQEVRELQTQLQSAQPSSIESLQPLQERVDLLERERQELQSCLDEAMQELEAVDQELRQSPTSGVEPLQHLYRWLLERSDQDVMDMPETAEGLVDAIQGHIESIPSTNLISNTDAALQVAELEAEISVYKGDLKARDESAAELRSSLKEAVALLKPLQDAVAKSEQEKQALQDEIDKLSSVQPKGDDLSEELADRERQIKELEKQVADLQEQVDLMKKTPSPVSSPERTGRSLQASSEEGHEMLQKERGSPASVAKTRQDLIAKRQSERALQEMLRNAQGRFHALHQSNHEIESENQALKDKVEDLEKELKELSIDHEAVVRRNVAAELREAAIQQLEQEVKGYSQELESKEEQIVKLEEELESARKAVPQHDEEVEKLKAKLEKLQEADERAEELKSELSIAKGDLETHKEAERVLTKSLKQALGLLRPLETHLETAEQEKKDLAKQLKVTRKQLAKLEAADSESRALSLPNEVEMKKDGLALQARQLEQQENTKLVNAYEEASPAGDENSKGQARLKESLVELNSRYEVTQTKLERAVVENTALVDALKHKERAERKMVEEMRGLKEDLMRTSSELENAKYIATSALVKVEELTMSNVEKMTLLRQGLPVDLSMDMVDLASPQRRALQARIETLQKEVEFASKANTSLAGSLEERTKMVEAITGAPSDESVHSAEQKQPDPPKSDIHSQRETKVSWGN